MYGLGYKFTLEQKTDDDAINRDGATAKAKFLIEVIFCFVTFCTHKKTERKLSHQIVCRAPTAIHYIEKTVFRKM